VQQTSFYCAPPELRRVGGAVSQKANDFHALWRKAEAGQSEFMPVFLPWSIDPSYRTAVSDDFQMTAEEAALAELHSLDKEQIAWRRQKVMQLSSEDLFAQEYPITASEAFISDSFDSYIPSELVLQAEALIALLLPGERDRVSTKWNRIAVLIRCRLRVWSRRLFAAIPRQS